MKYLLLSVVWIFAFEYSQAQNLTLLSRMDYQALHATYLNDIWGYVAPDGTEYALVGARKGTSVVDLSDPANPQEVLWIPGGESVWRDLKCFGNYAYVTTEAADGLLIIDLNSLPNVAGVVTKNYMGPVDDPWQSAHNIYIDSAGYAYIFGANRGNKGIIILDIHTDPMNPIEVGRFDDWYCHDGYALGNRLYGAHIYEGILSVIDITDRANPVLLGTQLTPSNFSHNIWVSPDGQYGFTTDEVSGAYLASFDLSDPAAIRELDKIRSSEGEGVVPHNTHYLNDYLITSYYSDGITIHDVSRPHNMLQTGAYDTYPIQTKGTDGCWGAYPFLPSGIILATDIEEGLFVLQPNYRRACYLEGNVSSSANNQPIPNVNVSITGIDNPEVTDINGAYATGSSTAGNYEVNYFAIGYYPKTIMVSLSEGNLLIQDVQLDPIPAFPVKIVLRNQSDNSLLSNVHVRLEGSLTTNELLTNGLGEALFSLYYEENYDISCGKWTFQGICLNQLLNATTGTIELSIAPGYFDDFNFDLGWTTQVNGAKTGWWVREKPHGSSSGSAPDVDFIYDCDGYTWITGNKDSDNPDLDDVDDGEVVLVSPLMDLSAMSDPWLHFYTWFYNYHGAFPFDDSLKVYLSDGSQQVLIHELHSDTNLFFYWHQNNIRVLDYLPNGNNMRLIIKVSDQPGNINVTKGAFDYFRVDESPLGSLDELKPVDLILYPNPADQSLIIKGLENGSSIELYDLHGKLMQQIEVMTSSQSIDLSELSSGLYLIRNGHRQVKLLVQH